MKTKEDASTAGAPAMHILSFRPQKGTLQERRYRRQTAHQKSRNGCLRCKARRVKCDEAKPRCARCLKTKTHCEYSPAVEKPSIDQSIPLILLQNHSPGIETHVLIRQFHIVFPQLTRGTANTSSVLAFALQDHHTFLLRAALAVSASHLRYHSMSKNKYRASENWQQMQAITGFNTALTTAKLNQSLADALVLTSVLINVLTFSCVEDYNNIRSSWLFAGNAQLSWFSVNLGLKALIQRTTEYQQHSILEWMYTSSDDESCTFYGTNEHLDIIPDHWKEFLGLEYSSRSAILSEPARFLAAIRTIEPTPESHPLYLNFMGSIDTNFQFRNLLLRRDSRAVWLLGYWMGLLCRLDCWWTEGRARLEWQATCVWMQLQLTSLDQSCDRPLCSRMMDELHAANVWDIGLG
ncbi:hypothetical protein VHEMI04677 [[Torrubiella] hemipterigena]|uniref:Zn(2)-C6 fungal-type domain-containing protein n=1 Tax=[Torrubiella] hemipterigena TaxID=1531966 RepID=A0A0A1SVY2_9HYPO|nr:hypothetical protein VHEMI04677 [[Torrubiella] hemipterigena]